MPLSRIDWVDLRAKLPSAGEDSPAEAASKESALFAAFAAGEAAAACPAGTLSLAAVDSGAKAALGLHAVFDAKAVIMRAFQAAAASDGSSGDYVTEGAAFGVVLAYVRRYAELWQLFDEVDINNSLSDDRSRFGRDALRRAAPLIEAAWGVRIGAPDAVFKAVGAASGPQTAAPAPQGSAGEGVIAPPTLLFDSFADWVIKQKLSVPAEAEEVA